MQSYKTVRSVQSYMPSGGVSMFLALCQLKQSRRMSTNCECHAAETACMSFNDFQLMQMLAYVLFCCTIYDMCLHELHCAW